MGNHCCCCKRENQEAKTIQCEKPKEKTLLYFEEICTPQTDISMKTSESVKHKRIKSEIPSNIPNTTINSSSNNHTNFLSSSKSNNHQKKPSYDFNNISNLNKESNLNDVQTNKKEKKKKNIAFKEEDTQINNYNEKSNSIINNNIENNQPAIVKTEKTENNRTRSKTNIKSSSKEINDIFLTEEELILVKELRSKSFDSGSSHLNEKNNDVDEMLTTLFNCKGQLNFDLKNELKEKNFDSIEDSSFSSEEENENINLENKINNIKEITNEKNKFNYLISSEDQELLSSKLSPNLKNLFENFVQSQNIRKENEDDGNKSINNKEKKISQIHQNLRTNRVSNKDKLKPIRRKSEENSKKKLIENAKIRQLLQELQLFNRNGSNFIVKISKGKPLIKTGGGYISLEQYLKKLIDKLSKKSKNKEIPKIDLNPELTKKLSDYLVHIAGNMNEDEENSSFITARMQRRPTGWNKKSNLLEKENKKLKIDEKISVQVVSPNRSFKF